MSTDVVPCTGASFGDAVLKMEKLRQLSDAVARARQYMCEAKTPQAAMYFIALRNQRDALRKLLPPLHVVS